MDAQRHIQESQQSPFAPQRVPMPNATRSSPLTKFSPLEPQRNAIPPALQQPKSKHPRNIRAIIQVSRRIVQPNDFGGDPAIYFNGGWFPEYPAEALKQDELNIVTSVPENSLATGDFITVISCERLREKYAPLVASWGEPARAQSRINMSTEARIKLMHECLDILEEDFRFNGREVSSLGPNQSPTGYQAVSFNEAINRVIGMHIDTHTGNEQVERRHCKNRFCLNLSEEPRVYQFVNMRTDTIFAASQALNIVPPNAKDIGPRSYLNPYFSLNKNTAVYSISVPPFCAYIAPTENIPHDGSTWGRKKKDATFTVMGHFLPRSSSPLPSEMILIPQN